MNYIEEWEASGVDETVTKLNVISLEGRVALDYLFYSDDIKRRNDGRVAEDILKRYQHTEAGGWWCSGVDLLTGEEDLWGCFKPQQPRVINKKLIKYEHPPKTSTGVFALRIPVNLWEQIAQRYSLLILPEEIEAQQPDLGFWQWVIKHREVPVCVTEGAKKAGALLSAGYAGIALPGINNGYRVPRDDWGNIIGKSALIPQLQILAQEKREIYLAFDQDTKPKTIQAVTQAMIKLGYLLKQAGAKVKVITWSPQLGKGVDDLIANHTEAAFAEAYETALDWDSWKAQSFAQLTQTINLELNCRYLPYISIPPSVQLIALKSAKGTGKTDFLGRISAQVQAQGRKVLLIGHRIKLLQSLCARFQIKYISEVSINKQESYGICIDSLHPNSQAKFNPQDWQNTLLIIDEVEQVLWHLLNSSTCKGKRVAIIKSFKQLLQTVFSSGGQVFIADADLSDIAVNYLSALAGVDLEPFIIYNRWRPTATEACEVYTYPENSPKRLVRDLEKHIQDGGKPLVCLSAQKPKSPWGTLTLESYLGKKFPEAKILRIDSESSTQIGHPANSCTDNLNKILAKYDIVLASPAIETGISIDLRGHFTSVWAIAQGVQTPESVCQALARVRENVPRYIWVAKYGFNQVGNGSTSIPALLKSRHSLTKANISLLQQSDFEAIDDIDTGFQSESLLCWAKIAVRVNASMLNYRSSTYALLQQNGLQLVEKLGATRNSCQEQNALAEAINEVQQQNYEAECRAISRASDLTTTQYRQLKYKLLKSKQEKLSLRKYELKQRYSLPVTPQLVSQDDRGWYHQLRLHYFLTVGRSYLVDRDVLLAANLIKNGQGALFAPDFNNSQLGPTISTLEMLQIPQIISDVTRELSNQDENLQRVEAIALQYRKQIKILTNIGLSQKSTPIRIVKRLLTMIGFDIQFVRVSKGVRYYRIVSPQDRREIIFSIWLRLDKHKPGNSEALF